MEVVDVVLAFNSIHCGQVPVETRVYAFLPVDIVADLDIDVNEASAAAIAIHKQALDDTTNHCSFLDVGGEELVNESSDVDDMQEDCHSERKLKLLT